MIAAVKKLVFQLLPEKQKQKIWIEKVGVERMKFNYSFGLHPTFVVSKGNKSWTKRSSDTDGHEPGVVKWISDNQNRIRCFFDVGASFGFFSAMVTQLRPEVDIHSFEPSVYFRTWLEENLKAVPESQKHVVKKFAGSKIDAQTVTLDQYAISGGVVPDLVKMDVDGAETEVLKGASNILRNGHTCWLIEVHPTDLPKFNSSVEQLLSLVPDTLGIRYLYNLRTGLSPWQTAWDKSVQEDFFICLFPAESFKNINW